MYACIVIGFDNKTHLRSSFFNDLDEALNYADQYLGIIALQDINTGKYIYIRNENTLEMEPAS